MFQRLLQQIFSLFNGQPALPQPDLRSQLASRYGIKLIEQDPKGNARQLTLGETATMVNTIKDLGPEWYGPFLRSPINLWVDRNPGGGGYGNGWLRIGDTKGDVTALYRILIHEGTHASNEYRNWLYENHWCFKPGFDWRKEGETWHHPRQQGAKMESGNWETLPVDSRDVSTSPGEDLAESVRYYVHSVKNERQFLWPLDKSKPPLYLWTTSPTRFVFVRDIFLKLPPTHPWYKMLTPAQEQLAAENMAADGRFVFN
jgi:hypothetical protein